MTKALATPPLDRYKPYWSLAPIKYSGVCVLAKKDLAHPQVQYRIPPCAEDIPGGQNGGRMFECRLDFWKTLPPQSDEGQKSEWDLGS